MKPLSDDAREAVDYIRKWVPRPDDLPVMIVHLDPDTGTDVSHGLRWRILDERGLWQPMVYNFCPVGLISDQAYPMLSASVVLSLSRPLFLPQSQPLQAFPV